MKPSNELKVGITVTIVIILFIGVIVFIGQWDTLFVRQKELHVRFDHRSGIQGLRIKDPVRIGGLNVGRVERIWLQEDTIKTEIGKEKRLFVHVIAAIPADIKLYPDCKITIGAKFVGEGGTLDILDTGSKGTPITEKDIITGLAPEGFAQLTSKLSRELDETNPKSLLYQIKSQLDPKNAKSIIAKIHKTLGDINIISAKVRSQVDETNKKALLAKLHNIIDNLSITVASLKRELSRNIDSTTLAKVHLALDKINNSLSSVNDLLAENKPKISSAVTYAERSASSIAKELDRNRRDSLISKLHESISLAQANMKNIKQLTQTGKELITINRESIQMVIDNLAETSAHLKATAKELRRHPWRLLYKPEKSELEYANLLETARAFADAANSLEIVNSKLNQLMKLHPEGIPSTDPEYLKIKEEIHETFCKFDQVQKKLWKLLKQRT